MINSKGNIFEASQNVKNNFESTNNRDAKGNMVNSYLTSFPDAVNVSLLRK